MATRFSPPRLWFAGFCFVASSSSIACHRDDVGHDSPLVGGFCDDDAQCVDRCVSGNAFPDGTCTVDCRDDRDCPGGTLCIDRAGGICLLPCTVDDACRPAYECETQPRQGHAGEAAICIND